LYRTGVCAEPNVWHIKVMGMLVINMVFATDSSCYAWLRLPR
jgi:hypothetical protein